MDEHDEFLAALGGLDELDAQDEQDEQGSARLAPAPAPRRGGIDLGRMEAITRHSESRNRDYDKQGRVITSRAGARYAMQVMPATARDPGYGIRPARKDTPEEWNRVGREKLAAMMKRYNGDQAKAWAAYNWGEDNVDRAVRKHGERWLSVAPAETRNYVAQNLSMWDGGGSGAPRRSGGRQRVRDAMARGMQMVDRGRPAAAPAAEQVDENDDFMAALAAMPEMPAPMEEPKEAAQPDGFFKATGKALMAGVGDARSMGAKAIKWAVGRDDFIGDVTATLDKNIAAGEAMAKEWEPNLEGAGVGTRVAAAGVRGATAAVPVLASLAVGGPLGAGVTGLTYFGGSAAQDSYDRVLKDTGDRDAANKAGWAGGAIHGVGDTAMTLLGGHALKGARSLLPVRGKSATEVARGLTDMRVLAPWAKNTLKLGATGAATEVAQDLGSEMTDRYFGAKPKALGPKLQGSAEGGLGMGLIFGALGLPGHFRRARSAAEFKAILDDPNVPLEERAKAWDVVVTEARRQGVDAENVDQWLDQQFEQVDADTRAREQAEAAEQEARYDRQAMENRGRWAQTATQLVEKQAQERDAAQERASGLLLGRADPLLGAIQQAREEAQVQADAERRAFMQQTEDTSSLMAGPNAALVQGAIPGQGVGLGEASAAAAAPQAAPQAQVDPVQERARQVAAAEQERNQRARKDFGIVKQGALATFGELDQAHVDGLVSDEQFAEMAGRLAGDATALSTVRLQLNEIMQQVRVLEQEVAQREADARAVREQTDPDLDVAALEADLEAVLESEDAREPRIVPQEGESRGVAMLRTIDEQRAERAAAEGKKARPMNEKQRLRVMLAMGFDQDGHPPADGVMSPRSLEDIAAIEAAVFPNDPPPKPKSISKSLIDAGVTTKAVKSTMAADVSQDTSQDDPGAVQDVAEEAQDALEEGAAPAQGAPQEGAVTTSARGIDRRIAEANRPQAEAAMAEHGVGEELGRALNYNPAAIATVPQAREMWSGSDAELDFDGLKPRQQAEYVQAMAAFNAENTRPGATEASKDAAWKRFTAVENRVIDQSKEYDKGGSEDVAAQRRAPLDTRSTDWSNEDPLAVADMVDGQSIAKVVSLVPAVRESAGAIRTTEGTYQVTAANRQPLAIKRAVFAALFTVNNHPVLGPMARRALRGLDSIGLFKPTAAQQDVMGFYSRNSNALALNAEEANWAANNPDAVQPAASLANTVAHELGHKADHDGGAAIGHHDYASTYPGGPLHVGVFAGEGGSINFNLGPVVAELLQAHKDGLLPTLDQAFGPLIEAQLRAENFNANTRANLEAGPGGRGGGARPGVLGRPGAAGPNVDSRTGDGSQDGSAGQPRAAGAQNDAQAPGMDAGADAAGGQGAPGAVGAAGGRRGHNLRLSAEKAARNASFEAWGRMVEAMLVDPQAFKAIAPKAHALAEAALKARSDTQFGNLLAGLTPVDGGKAPTTDSLLPSRSPLQAKKLTPSKRSVPAKRPKPDDGKSPPADDVAFSLNAPLAENQREALAKINSAVSQLLGDGMRWMQRSVAFTRDLVDAADKYVPSARKFYDLKRAVSAARVASERNIDSVLEDYDALKAEEKGTGAGTVNAFLKASTMAKKWGYQPEHLKGRNVKVDPALKAQFEALSPEAQAVVKRVFEHGYNSLHELKREAAASFDSDVDVLIEQARRNGDKEAEAKAVATKLRASKQFASMAALDDSWPYAPLKRFGNFVVVARSADLVATERIVEDKTASEAARAAARKRLHELRQDGKHYRVDFRESRGEARALAEQMRETNQYAHVDNFAKEAVRDSNLDTLGAFHRLREMVNDSTDAALRQKSAAALDQLMTDLHLSLLSEQSARQAERHREGVAGADDNMMRAFESHGRAVAHFTAALTSTKQIQQAIADMRDEVRNGEHGSREERQDFFNELLKRHMVDMDYRPDPVVSKVMSLTSTWMLLTSPSYHMINATQPWAMSMPLMAGKHGYGRSQAALVKAYRELGPIIKDGVVSQEDYHKLPKDVRDAVNALTDAGVIDISLESNLGRWGREGNQVVASVSLKLNKVAQTVETFNRLSTAVAALRLEAERNGGKIDQAGIDYARDVIDSTHFDYSGFNAPRFMRTRLGAAVTQFRKFQLGQATLFVRLVHDSFKDSSPQERALARRALAYSVGHMAILGGTTGLPGFMLGAWILDGLATVFGDDDEPWTTEEALRKAVGPEWALLLTRGVPAALGYDISHRAAAGEMLSPLPYTDVKFSRDGWNAVLAGVAGPFMGGIMPRAMDGVGLMAKGDYVKGLENLLPKGLSDALKAVRQEAQGVTNRRGDVLLTPQEVKFAASMGQALGLPGTQLSERARKASVAYQIDQFYKDRSAAITREYVKAAKAQDSAGMARAREKWLKFQQARREAGFKPQPLSTLVKAPRAQAKREARTVGGLQYSTGNRAFVEALARDYGDDGRYDYGFDEDD